MDEDRSEWVEGHLGISDIKTTRIMSTALQVLSIFSSFLSPSSQAC